MCFFSFLEEFLLPSTLLMLQGFSIWKVFHIEVELITQMVSVLRGGAIRV